MWPENILSLRMTKTDALINWTPPHTCTRTPPPPGDMWGYMGNDLGFCNEPPPRRGDYHSLAGSLLFMRQMRDIYTGTSATQLDHMP